MRTHPYDQSSEEQDPLPCQYLCNQRLETMSFISSSLKMINSKLNKSIQLVFIGPHTMVQYFCMTLAKSFVSKA